MERVLGHVAYWFSSDVDVDAFVELSVQLVRSVLIGCILLLA